jgi:DNA-binding response OmpR family regulator
VRVQLGSRVLEVYGRDLHIDGERVRMTRREAGLLHYLLTHRERIVPRHELMEQVWGTRLIGTAARTVDIHVYRLRAKLGKDLAAHLETVRQAGYRFSATPAVPRVTLKPPHALAENRLSLT